MRRRLAAVLDVVGFVLQFGLLLAMFQFMVLAIAAVVVLAVFVVMWAVMGVLTWVF